MELPEGGTIHADKGYTDSITKIYSKRSSEAPLQRKKRSKRPILHKREFLAKPIRQYIETVQQAENAISRKIHAVTPRGLS